MDFEIWDDAKYRSLDLEALESRRSAIIDELGNAESAVATADLEAEAERCIDAIDRINKAAQLRAANIAAVNRGAGNVVAASKRAADKPVEDIDPFDTPEYRNAFMEFACRGKEMPQQFREGIYARNDAHTTTGDVPVMIPTTTMNRIIEELEADNGIWSRITKTNVKGGVEYPVLELKPVAQWVGETETQPWQKLEADLSIQFGYYEIECRISQTMLASIVTFDEFQRRFVPLATEAIIKKVEQGVIAGTGTGQMMGIVNDTNVATLGTTAELAAADIVSWKKWHSEVKAKIPRAYRKGTYIMAQSTWDTYIETLADDNNAPVSIGYNAVTGEEILRLMGNEVLLVDDDILPFFDDAEAGDVFAIYGNLADYAVNTNQQLQTVQYIDWDTRKKKTVAYMVLDGKVLDPYGFVLIKKKA